MFDLLERGFCDLLVLELPQIGRPLRVHPSGQLPAGPGPGRSALRVVSAHPGGQMLEMPPWISEETTHFAMPQDPANRTIGQGMSHQKFVVEGRIQPRPHRTVEHQQGLGGQTLQPPRLRTAQGQPIEFPAPRPLAEGSQRRSRKTRGPDVRQMRTKINPSWWKILHFPGQPWPLTRMDARPGVPRNRPWKSRKPTEACRVSTSRPGPNGYDQLPA